MTEIIQLGFNHLKTNLSIGYILSYLVYAIDFDTENLILEQIPGKSVYSNGVWVFDVDREKTNTLLDRLKF
ncbi:MAG: hypothetical protein IJ629_02085 [Clostridia bacterium]|nr:hypothetical protein [Clostridia bacterium]